jgi:hypothetical protein
MTTSIYREPFDLVKNRECSKWKMDVACQHIQCSIVEGDRIIGMAELCDIVSK